MKKLLYLALTVLIISCSSDDNSNVDDTQAEWLYVHTAIEANATNSRTLVIPVTNDIFAFTDRPDREHKYISAYEFVSYWSDNATNSFQFDPPNAVLTSVGDDGVAEVEVVIIDASTDGDNITYTIQNPKLTENATFEDVSLFVDDNVGVGSDFYIYQSYQGGRIAYIDSTGQHGLIAAEEDQSPEIQWYNGTYIVTGATGTAIGTGLSNTNAIIAVQGEVQTDYAAGLARAYNGGGYNDWYLPSQDELNILYELRALPNGVAIWGFTGDYYWSSTEYDNRNAWVQSFDIGYKDPFNKSYAMSVRAVRAF
jgi:hypothetical protein